MTKIWHIYFILGISGSWKWTLIKNLKNLQGDQFHFPYSYTTRTRRPGETDGNTVYKFVTQGEFFAGVEAGEFLEYAHVHNIQYSGTKMKDVYEEGVKKGKIVIKEIDFKGISTIRQERPDFDSYYSSVFLNIPKERLSERIEQRWVFMSDEEYHHRMKSAEIEEEQLSRICDYEIDATLSPEKVLEKFLEIIRYWEL